MAERENHATLQGWMDLCCLMTPGLRTFVSCMTILYLNLLITRSDIRLHIKWTVSLVTAYGYFNLPQGLCGYVWVHHPRGVSLDEPCNLTRSISNYKVLFIVNRNT